MPSRTSFLRGLIAATSLVTAACGSDSTGESLAEPSDTSAEVSTEAATPPALAVGSVTTGEVEIDGVVIEYVTATPEGFETGATAPLLLTFPPGGQTLGLAQSLVEGTYAAEAARLGWVVISPAAPDGVLFFQGSESLVPGFIDWAETWVTPEGGAPHVAGVSNGGLSSFRYAAENPDRVQSVVAFPGFPRSDADLAAMAGYADIPVRIFVGGNDTSWIAPAETTVETFEAAGGDIELRIFSGEGHIMSSTADGSVVFGLLESFR